MTQFFADERGKTITIKPVLSLSAYAANDVLSAIFEIDGFAASRNGAGVLVGWSIVDKIQQKPAVRLMFFEKKVATALAANDALAVSDADMEYFTGKVDSSTFVDVASTSSYYATDLSAPILMSPAEGKSIWCLPVITSGTPTYTAVDNLVIKLKVVPIR